MWITTVNWMHKGLTSVELNSARALASVNMIAASPTQLETNLHVFRRLQRTAMLHYLRAL